MRSIIQKLLSKGPLLVLATVFAVSSFVLSSPASVSAAQMQPRGTCFYSGPDGNKTETCKKAGLTTKDTDTDGNAVSFSNCYEVNVTVSSENIVHVNCDGSAISKKPPAQMCFDSQSGKTVPCITCPDGTPAATQADCSAGAATGGDCSTVSKCDLFSKYINPLIDFLAALVGVAVVISIIIGGIQYGSSAGDPQKTSAAKNRIRNAIIALITFLFLYALLNFLIPGGLL